MRFPAGGTVDHAHSVTLVSNRRCERELRHTERDDHTELRYGTVVEETQEQRGFDMWRTLSQRYWAIIVLAVGMVGLVFHNAAWGVQRNYTLDQNSSSITISGSVDGNTILTQGTNSLTAKYSGSIITDRQSNTINTISFSGGSSIDALVSGNWQPSVGGTSGTAAAADYGGRTTVSGANVKLAGRNLFADLVTGGAAMNIANGQFDLSTSDVNLVAGNVDYRGTITIIFEIEVLSGTYPLAGEGGSLTGSALLGVQSIGGGMLRETLTIPIDSTLPTIDAEGYPISLTLSGQLLATSDFADNGDRYWIKPTSETFATATNWNPSLTPGTTETAVFDLNGNHTVTFGANATNNRLRVENDQVAFALGTRTYTLTNTSTSTPSIIAGAAAGDNGRLSLTGTGGGGTLSSANAYLGNVASSTGQLTVGAGATWNNSLDLSVGRGGTGTLDHQ